MQQFCMIKNKFKPLRMHKTGALSAFLFQWREKTIFL